MTVSSSSLLNAPCRTGGGQGSRRLSILGGEHSHVPWVSEVATCANFRLWIPFCDDDHVCTSRYEFGVNYLFFFSRSGRTSILGQLGVPCVCEVVTTCVFVRH